jgi:hypothetical protein
MMRASCNSSGGTTSEPLAFSTPEKAWLSRCVLISPRSLRRVVFVGEAARVDYFHHGGGVVAAGSEAHGRGPETCGGGATVTQDGAPPCGVPALSHALLVETYISALNLTASAKKKEE